MNHFNSLSYNLQEIVLKKLFPQNNKYLLITELNNTINDYKISTKGTNSSFYRYMFYEQVGLCGDKCNYCKTYGNSKGFFQYFDDYPMYEKELIENNTYKYKSKFKSYWLHYMDSSSVRCAYNFNYVCYGCYHGYSKKPCKFFVYL